jgi:hypothetical protein
VANPHSFDTGMSHRRILGYLSEQWKLADIKKAANAAFFLSTKLYKKNLIESSTSQTLLGE